MALFVEDWTGTARRRRPQGDCLPPKNAEPANYETIPAGTPVLIRKKQSCKWIHHVTKVELNVVPIVKRKPDSVIFSHSGWDVAVSKRHIRPAKGKGRV